MASTVIPTPVPRWHSASAIRYWALAAAAVFLSADPLHSHPLQAEPVDHAHVFNFDQFYIPEDPDELVADGGLLLIAELNCAACHTMPDAWKDRLPTKPGPDLAAAGNRLNEDSLWRFIRSPQSRKKGTQMPGLFAGEEGDVEAVEAITQYLASLKKDQAALPEGDAMRGRETYHTVGCVACHEPASDYRPAKVAADALLEKPGLSSVPIALADDYDFQSLAHFLLDPLSCRPAGRMPSMRLTEQEASDIAAYLHTGRLPPKMDERALLQIPPQTVAQGREAFISRRCTACHTTGEEMPKQAAKPFAALKADAATGCLSGKIQSGIPRYDFKELQIRALRLAMQRVQMDAPAPFTAQQTVDWQMMRLNCYACHDRDSKGGPEEPRAQYFHVNDPGAESLGELAHLPPSLDRIGRKLTREWLERILWGKDGSVRPYIDTRMPNFGQAQTESLIAPLESADALAKPVEINVSGLEKHHRAESGRQLMGATGLACVACHGLKDRKSLGPPVLRLTHTVERLRPAFFKELLLNPQETQPGTVMPPLFMGRKKADQEIESIWTYLRELDGQPLPEGLLSATDFELKPDEAQRPIVFRSFIEGVGTHAIGVGFPGGLNAAFDAKTSRWVIVWKGRFLDAMSNWQERAMPPIKPLGTDVKEMPAAQGQRTFGGYRLNRDGVPTFWYQQDGKRVDDTLRPTPDGKGFEHLINIDGQETKEILSW